MNSKWDNMAGYLLKECYTLAAQSTQEDAARELLQARAQQIDLPEDSPPQQPGAAAPGPAPPPPGGPARAPEQAAHFEAENAYVQALSVLRAGTGEQQRTRALGCLTRSLQAEPGDPRVLALSQILIQVSRQGGSA